MLSNSCVILLMCLVAAASAQVHPIGRRASAKPGNSFIPKFLEVFRNASNNHKETLESVIN